MKTYRATSMHYADVADVMYVLLKDDADLSVAHRIEDTPSGASVMYDGSGAAVGVEIYDFSEKISDKAGVIKIDAARPFMVAYN